MNNTKKKILYASKNKVSFLIKSAGQLKLDQHWWSNRSHFCINIVMKLVVGLGDWKSDKTDHGNSSFYNYNNQQLFVVWGMIRASGCFLLARFEGELKHRQNIIERLIHRAIVHVTTQLTGVARLKYQPNNFSCRELQETIDTLRKFPQFSISNLRDTCIRQLGATRTSTQLDNWQQQNAIPIYPACTVLYIS